MVHEAACDEVTWCKGPIGGLVLLVVKYDLASVIRIHEMKTEQIPQFVLVVPS